MDMKNKKTLWDSVMELEEDYQRNVETAREAKMLELLFPYMTNTQKKSILDQVLKPEKRNSTQMSLQGADDT